MDAGDCSGKFDRFGFDIDTNECHQFKYGGCGGNGNNFATISECRSACVKGTFSEILKSYFFKLIVLRLQNVIHHVVSW